jgi:hypothetical protein
MENLFFQTECLSKNQLQLPLGENGIWSPIALQDVSKTLCGLLSEPEKHMNFAYDLSGPHAFTGQEIANILRSQLNRSIEYHPVSVHTYAGILQKSNVSANVAEQLSEYLGQWSRLDQQQKLPLISNKFFESLCKTQMTRLEEWCMQHQKVLSQEIGKIQPTTEGISQPFEVSEEYAAQMGVPMAGVVGQAPVSEQKFGKPIKEEVSEESGGPQVSGISVMPGGPQVSEVSGISGQEETLQKLSCLLNDLIKDHTNMTQ